MVKGCRISSIYKNTSSVIYYRTSVKGTSNWSSLINFVHHGLFPTDCPKFVHTINEILWGSFAGIAWLTVPTFYMFITSHPVIMPPCLVNRASLISNIVVMNELICTETITAMASIIGCIASQDHLGRYINIWPSRTSLNFNSI